MQYKWTALTATAVGTLLAGLDSRIVIVGLPTVAQQLHTGPAELVWITQAYGLASIISLLLIGRMADVFGRVRLYNIGFLIFTIGSALSSLSANSFQLIGFRVIQGIGSGILITNASAIITDASPKTELGTMLGINQMAFRVGSLAGLTLSGIILSVVDWRGLFYINVPIGVFGTFWSYKRLREISVRDKTKKLDWWGFGFFSSGISIILIAITDLSYGMVEYVSGYILLATGLGLIVLFVKFESHTFSPLLDLSLFKIRLFRGANIAQILNSLSWSGFLLLIVFYLQIARGYSALSAGFSILPLDVCYMISSLIGGRLSDRYETRLICTVGLIINTLGLLLISSFGLVTPYPEIVFALAFIGFGNGFFNPPNLSAIMGSVPARRVGTASAFRNIMFSVGSSVSYGLVVLFITLGISYSSFSALLQGTESTTSLAVAKVEFLDGFRITALILALIVAAAIAPSVVRGTRPSNAIPKVS